MFERIKTYMSIIMKTLYHILNEFFENFVLHIGWTFVGYGSTWLRLYALIPKPVSGKSLRVFYFEKSKQM